MTRERLSGLLTLAVVGILGMTVGLIVAPTVATPEKEYWQGWCAGHFAAFVQANEVMHDVRLEVLEALQESPALAPEHGEIFAKFFSALPFEFGENVGSVFVVAMRDGSRIACPVGTHLLASDAPQQVAKDRQGGQP